MIISTHNKHQRKGLCTKLLNCDIDEQMKQGIQGAITEATALNSQKVCIHYNFLKLLTKKL